MKRTIIIQVCYFFLLLISCAFPQSYDVEDASPPIFHTERTPLYADSPLFKEKYCLILDRECEDGRLIIDVRIANGSRPFDIKLSGDTVHVSLNATSFGKKRLLTSPVIFPMLFYLCIAMEGDTATYYVECDSISTAITVHEIAKAWFIEKEPIRRLPAGFFWIYQPSPSDAEIMENVKEKLNRESFAEYVVLDEGYYHCLPTPNVRIVDNRNLTDIGPIYFFRGNSSTDMKKVSEILDDYDQSNSLVLDFH